MVELHVHTQDFLAVIMYVLNIRIEYFQVNKFRMTLSIQKYLSFENFPKYSSYIYLYVLVNTLAYAWS